jgi:hypothetical protein
MERLINSDSILTTQLWNRITLRNPEVGGGTFSETLILTRGTWYRVPEDIYKSHEI